jgi:hypothetical protein
MGMKPQRNNFIDSIAGGVANGLTAGFLDEIIGGMSGISAKLSPYNKRPFLENYKQGKNWTLSEIDARKQDNPKSFAVGNFVGELKNPVAKLTSPYIKEGNNRLDRIKRAGLAGLYNGFIKQEGKAETMKDTFNKDTIKSVAIGGALKTGGRGAAEEIMRRFDIENGTEAIDIIKKLVQDVIAENKKK